MPFFASVKLRCPLCSLEFSADERHGEQPIGWDSDFRPHYAANDPLPTLVHCCPGCRYSGYREQFWRENTDDDELFEPVEDDDRALPRPYLGLPDDDEVEALRRYARSADLSRNLVFEGKEPVGAIRYVLAARAWEFQQEGDLLGVAHFMLRAAWCARVSGDKRLERETTRGVLIRVGGVVERERGLHLSQRLRLLYLQGELSRRVGNFAQAIEYLAQVESLADTDDPEAALLTALARRMTRLAVVKSAVDARLPEQLLAGRVRPEEDDSEDDEDAPLRAASGRSDDDDDDDDGAAGGGLN